MIVETASKDKLPKRLMNRAHDSMFKAIHSSSLIYNACWEDPRLDRRMLGLGEGSRVVMITSAGCNALDYLLDGPSEIHTIDVNPRQNALLELKLALFAHGDYNELWRMFGEGVRPRVVDLLDKLKPWLGAETYELWKRKHQYFEGGAKRSTFFYRGAAGSAAWLGVKVFEGSCPGGRKMLEELMNAGSIAEQKKIYKDLEGKFWNAFNRWLLQQSFIMALLGVPRPQIDLMQNQYPGGLERFVRDKLDHTLTELPISENYFWRAYSLGSYSTSCCPNYVKREHFETLRERRDRIHLHTMTMAEFLERNPGKYTHFVLLDHQDWLASHDTVALEQEWELILANSAPGAKVLMRSASPRIDFIPAKILKRLKIADGTAELHELDRVGTYGCTLLAEVA